MSLRRSLLYAALPLALLGACGQSASGHFDDARKAFAAEDFATARTELIAALEKDPADPAMRELQVRTLLRLGDGEGALNALARLKRNNPPAPAKIARYEAEAALLVGAADDAIALLADDPGADAWRIRAAARIANGDPAAASEAFAKGLAVAEEPALLAAYARFALRMDDRALAQRLEQRLKAIRPDGLDTLLIGGMLASAASDRATAMTAFKAAAQRYPHRYEPLFAQAEQLELQDKLPAAAKLADRAAQIAPTARDVQELQLRLLKVTGQWEKLRGLLQGEEATLEPGSARGLAYAEALLNLGHPEQARITFQRALLLMPGNRYARMMLGQAQSAAGDTAGAWETLRPLTEAALVQPFEMEAAEQAARKAGAPEADGLRQRRLSAAFASQVDAGHKARAAAARGDWEGAATHYRSLLAAGDDAEVLTGLAHALGKQGRYGEAIGFADKALAADPSDPERQHLAGLLRIEGKTDIAYARQLLKAAADGAPGNAAFAADGKTAGAAAD